MSVFACCEDIDLIFRPGDDAGRASKRSTQRQGGRPGKFSRGAADLVERAIGSDEECFECCWAGCRDGCTTGETSGGGRPEHAPHLGASIDVVDIAVGAVGKEE